MRKSSINGAETRRARAMPVRDGGSGACVRSAKPSGYRCSEMAEPLTVTPRCSSAVRDRKSTRLNSSHLGISYAVFCLKKKKTTANQSTGRETLSGPLLRDADALEV